MKTEDLALGKVFLKNDISIENNEIIFDILKIEMSLPKFKKENSIVPVRILNDVLKFLYIYNLKEERFVFINKSEF